MEQLVPVVVSRYLARFEKHFTQPSFRYFCGYLLAVLLTSGRTTTTRIAQTCFFVDHHLASWERFLAEHRWDPSALVGTLLELLQRQAGDALQVHGAYLAVVDTCVIAKNGTRMQGVQAWREHSGNADRGAQVRGQQWGVLGLLGFDEAWERVRCFPLLMRLIPGQLNPFQFIVNAAGEAQRATFWDGVLPLVWHLQTHLQAPLRVVADAYFAKAPFVQPLVDRGIHVITRLRKDAVGWDDPESRNKARRRDKWKLARLLEAVPVQQVPVQLYGEAVTVWAVCREVWLRAVQQKVKVVVLAGDPKPILLLSTDVHLTMAQIIEIYAARFPIELAIRALKTHLGLADYQCYLPTAIHRFVHLRCVAYCLFRLMQLTEDLAAWLPPRERGQTPFSFTRLRKGLQRFVIGRILSPKFSEIPKAADCETELDAILRIAA